MATKLLDEPHHDGSSRYVSTCSPALGERVPVRLVVPAASEAEQVLVRTVVDGEPVWVRAERVQGWSAGVGQVPGRQAEQWWQAEVTMAHPVMRYRFLLVGGHAVYRFVNAAGVWDRDVPDREDFVLSTASPPPQWLAGTVAYQVFPDRFARRREDAPGEPSAAPVPSWATATAWDEPVQIEEQRAVHQLYRGDLDGVREHLDHLAGLGVNLLYLTPFFPALSSHRYNATTFDHVDPLLGGDEALARLVAEAHERGIKVIGDLTTNHSGSHHAWFEAALADASSAEAGFYFFDEHPQRYVAWQGVASLPKFDLTSTELRERLVRGSRSVVHRWLDEPVGLDGWRIDVANMTGRHGTVDVNAEIAGEIRATMRAVRPDAWLLAEHCHDASADLGGEGWHGTMAYQWFTRPVWSWLQGARGIPMFHEPRPLPHITGRTMVDTMRSLAAAVPWPARVASMTLLDSHDTARFRTVAGSRERQIVGVALLATMPGVPMVFAGDEVGVEGCCMNAARQPFPWDENRWDHRLHDAYRRLLHLRAGSPALQDGGLRWVAATDDAVTFVREHLDERVLVHAARSAHEPVVLDAGALGVGTSPVDALFGDHQLVVGDDGCVTLPADGPAAHVWRLPAPSPPKFSVGFVTHSATHPTENAITTDDMTDDTTIIDSTEGDSSPWQT